jgi:hypothetical protein
VILQDFLGHGKTQSDPFIGDPGREKGFENPVQIFLLDPFAGVADLDRRLGRPVDRLYPAYSGPVLWPEKEKQPIMVGRP